MNEEGNQGVVKRFWAAVRAKDWDAHDEIIDEDYVQEWPQSGERIRGKSNSRSLKESYPTERTPSLRRILGEGDVWIMETTIDYGNEVAQGIHVLELRNGKIIRETDYFAQPFDAPAWRAQWVERF